MSLPAGASITTVGGKRCTVYPRAAATTNNTVKSPDGIQAAVVAPLTSSSGTAVVNDAADPVDPSTSAIPSTPTPAPQLPPTTSTAPPAATSSVVSPESTTSSALPDSLTSPTQQSLTLASSSIPDTAATTPTSTSSIPPFSNGPTNQPVAGTSQTQSATAVAAIEPTSSLETPLSISSASVATIQTSGTFGSLPGVTTFPSVIPPTNAAGDSPATSSAAVTANLSSSKSVVGAVMGGVVGGLALVGILLFFCWRYHRKRGTRHSLLTPLNTHFSDRYQSDKYEIDGSSLGPTSRGTRWKAQAEGICSRAHMSIGNFGVSIKAKLGGRNNTPTINMDRGNSQFLEPSPQHSRSGSATSIGAVDVRLNREHFRDRWNRFAQKVKFNWRLHTGTWKSTDRSVTTGKIMAKAEPHQGQIPPEFSNPQAAKDRQLRLGSGGHRRSLSTAGLDFGTLFPSAQPTIPDLTKMPVALTSNPFQTAMDPASFSGPKSNSSNYLANVQRSRGLSQPTPASSLFGSRPLGGNTTNVNSPPRYPSTTTAAQPGSRYSSMIRNSLDSSRDTIISGCSTSGRKAKCRSDPFDLERPELLRPALPIAPENQSGNMGFSALPPISTGAGAQGGLYPHTESIHAGRLRIVSATDSFASSKYSSGTSAILHEWGGSGPDLGSFAWERGSPLSPQDGRVAKGRGLGYGSTEGVVGRAL